MSAFVIRTITHSVIAETVDRRSGCPVKHPSPKKSPVPRIATTASFPCSEMTVFLDLAALNVENRIRGFALRVNNLILPVIGNGSPAVYFREKYFGIEREPGRQIRYGNTA
jgi:hypothetical protein